MNRLEALKAAYEAFAEAEATWDAKGTQHEYDDVDRAYDVAYTDLCDALFENRAALIAVARAGDALCNPCSVPCPDDSCRTCNYDDEAIEGKWERVCRPALMRLQSDLRTALAPLVKEEEDDRA